MRAEKTTSTLEFAGTEMLLTSTVVAVELLLDPGGTDNTCSVSSCAGMASVTCTAGAGRLPLLRTRIVYASVDPCDGWPPPTTLTVLVGCPSCAAWITVLAGPIKSGGTVSAATVKKFCNTVPSATLSSTVTLKRTSQRWFIASVPTFRPAPTRTGLVPPTSLLLTPHVLLVEPRTYVTPLGSWSRMRVLSAAALPSFSTRRM